MVKKPQGWNAVVELDSGKPFSPIVLPEGKSEREAMIVKWFSTSLKAHRTPELQINGAVQNPEDDFDFTIKTDEGAKNLELTEFAPLSGSGFERASDILNVGTTADALTNAIIKKADHYSHKPPGLILLIIPARADGAFA